MPIVLSLAACGPASSDPAFGSETLVSVRGSDCAADRCVVVTLPADGSKEGEGSSALYGPGDLDDLESIAESGQLEMVPGEKTIWKLELPDVAAGISNFNAVCEPMAEG